MHNVLQKIPQVSRLVQVGIRDVCEQEIEYCLSQGQRVRVFTDRELRNKQLSGIAWSKLADEIVAQLPPQVWVSFDVDGLDPRYCPHTGTPVPGGLDFAEANFILGALARSGRRIVGFDLNEVAPNPENERDEWDANVGARLLYKLTGWTLASQGLARAL
jgi:agmatinase